jgi:hypothetical protein
VQQANYATGASIEMRLMARDRNSLLAVPVGDLNATDFNIMENNMDGGQLYVKLIKASRIQVGTGYITGTVLGTVALCFFQGDFIGFFSFLYDILHDPQH